MLARRAEILFMLGSDQGGYAPPTRLEHHKDGPTTQLETASDTRPIT
jgi:hypothetical protein